MSHVTSCHVTLKVMSRHGVQCDMSCHVVLSLPLQCMSLLSSHHDRCVQCSGTRFLPTPTLKAHLEWEHIL